MNDDQELLAARSVIWQKAVGLQRDIADAISVQIEKIGSVETPILDAIEITATLSGLRDSLTEE